MKKDVHGIQGPLIQAQQCMHDSVLFFTETLSGAIWNQPFFSWGLEKEKTSGDTCSVSVKLGIVHEACDINHTKSNKI